MALPLEHWITTMPDQQPPETDEQRAGRLAREYAVAQEQLDSLAGARAADSARYARDLEDYRKEVLRLNTLTCDLTRNLIDARNSIDLLSRGCLVYVQFFVDAFAHFEDTSLSFDTQANLILARQLLAQSIELPM